MSAITASPVLAALDLSREALAKALHEVQHNTPDSICHHYARVFGGDYAKYMGQQLEYAIKTIGFLMEHQEYAERAAAYPFGNGLSQVARDLHLIVTGEVAS